MPVIAAVRRFTFAVSLIRQVFFAVPVASVTDVACVTTPFPDVADHVTVMLEEGWPLNVTFAATCSVDPTRALCTASAESGAMLYVGLLVPPPGVVGVSLVPESFEQPSAATAKTTREAKSELRMGRIVTAGTARLDVQKCRFEKS